MFLVFKWPAPLYNFSFRSDKINSNMPNLIANAISMQQFKNSAFSNISVADMLAARQDLALIDKV